MMTTGKQIATTRSGILQTQQICHSAVWDDCNVDIALITLYG
jgi:hypothetical protein